MAEEPVEDYIYVSRAGADAILPYLRLPVEHPEVFHFILLPVTAVILAYSNAHQGTDKAVASLCITHNIYFQVIDAPRASGGQAAFGAFFGKLAKMRGDSAGGNVVFIVRYCERQYARGAYHGDPEFLPRLLWAHQVAQIQP